MVVANLDQAFAVAQRLPHWPILNRGMSVVAGLSRWQRRILAEREIGLVDVEERLIATLDQIRGLPLYGFDNVLFAAGGRRLPDWFRIMAISGQRSCRTLQLMDLDDRHDSQLCEDSECRFRTYRRWGWTADSGKAAIDRVRAYITEKLGACR